MTADPTAVVDAVREAAERLLEYAKWQREQGYKEVPGLANEIETVAQAALAGAEREAELWQLVAEAADRLYGCGGMSNPTQKERVAEEVERMLRAALAQHYPTTERPPFDAESLSWRLHRYTVCKPNCASVLAGRDGADTLCSCGRDDLIYVEVARLEKAARGGAEREARWRALLEKAMDYFDYMEERGYSSVRWLRSEVATELKRAALERAHGLASAD